MIQKEPKQEAKKKSNNCSKSIMSTYHMRPKELNHSYLKMDNLLNLLGLKINYKLINIQQPYIRQ